MGYEDGRRLNFVKPGQASHRAAAQVHEGLGFKQPQGLAVDGGAGHQCLVVFVNNPAGFDLPCDRIRPPKPALCRVCSYSGPGLPKPTIMLIMGRIIRPPVGCQSARPTLGGPLELGPCGLPFCSGRPADSAYFWLELWLAVLWLPVLWPLGLP